jgi:hypothetical protein
LVPHPSEASDLQDTKLQLLEVRQPAVSVLLNPHRPVLVDYQYSLECRSASNLGHETHRRREASATNLEISEHCRAESPLEAFCGAVQIIWHSINQLQSRGSALFRIVRTRLAKSGSCWF